MFTRMGELLVEYGELTNDELSAILAEQKTSYRAFGHIAAERFDVSEEAIWRAWAEQYAQFCPWVDLGRERIDPLALERLSAEDARSRLLLPLRWQDGDLVLVTARDRLAESLQFVDRELDEDALLWLAEANDLAAAIDWVYRNAAIG
ncbi:MAG: hypothetical protein ACF8PN_09150 [Phycisphaerales bacterium]